MAAYRLYTVVPRLVKFVDNLTNWWGTLRACIDPSSHHTCARVLAWASRNTLNTAQCVCANSHPRATVLHPAVFSRWICCLCVPRVCARQKSCIIQVISVDGLFFMEMSHSCRPVCHAAGSKLSACSGLFLPSPQLANSTHTRLGRQSYHDDPCMPFSLFHNLSQQQNMPSSVHACCSARATHLVCSVHHFASSSMHFCACPVGTYASTGSGSRDKRLGVMPRPKWPCGLWER